MNDMTRSPQLSFDGARIRLRPLEKADAGLIEMHASDPRVAKMTLAIPHPLPPGATEAVIARAQDPSREQDIWAIDASANGGSEVVGLIGLKRLDQEKSEIMYWVAPAFWNNGTASDAVDTLLAANPLGNTTIFASVFQDNPASARVLTNAGFDYIGDAETFSVSRGAKAATWTYLRKLS